VVSKIAGSLFLFLALLGSFSAWAETGAEYWARMTREKFSIDLGCEDRLYDGPSDNTERCIQAEKTIFEVLNDSKVNQAQLKRFQSIAVYAYSAYTRFMNSRPVDGITCNGTVWIDANASRSSNVAFLNGLKSDASAVLQRLEELKKKTRISLDFFSFQSTNISACLSNLNILAEYLPRLERAGINQLHFQNEFDPAFGHDKYSLGIELGGSPAKVRQFLEEHSR
jgi:hypothetical protein